ncbi:MAG TPA: GIY-YIG nuclease family protein, partial [Marmoricola sp.]|nr:GIY-YIG nuclease family protein [Marmoricola sp.]
MTTQQEQRFKVYVHYSGTTCLYVGQTKRGIRKRTEEHEHHSPWANRITKIEWFHFDTKAEMDAAERTLIWALKPLHNLMHTDPEARAERRMKPPTSRPRIVADRTTSTTKSRFRARLEWTRDRVETYHFCVLNRDCDPACICKSPEKFSYEDRVYAAFDVDLWQEHLRRSLGGTPREVDPFNGIDFGKAVIAERRHDERAGTPAPTSRRYRPLATSLGGPGFDMY